VQVTHHIDHPLAEFLQYSVKTYNHIDTEGLLLPEDIQDVRYNFLQEPADLSLGQVHILDQLRKDLVAERAVFWNQRGIRKAV